MKIVNLVGKIFNRLTVVRLTGESRGESKIWECKCSCGNICFITTRHLNRRANKIQSCGCLKIEHDNKRGKDSEYFQGYEGISQTFWNLNVLKSAKGNKNVKSRKELEINIDKKYLWDLWEKQKGICALSGIKIFLPTYWKDSLYTASVDRIDSSKGYIIGNVQWVHKHINLMKNKLSQNYFIEICKQIALYKGGSCGI